MTEFEILKLAYDALLQKWERLNTLIVSNPALMLKQEHIERQEVLEKMAEICEMIIIEKIKSGIDKAFNL